MKGCATYSTNELCIICVPFTFFDLNSVIYTIIIMKVMNIKKHLLRIPVYNIIDVISGEDQLWCILLDIWIQLFQNIRLLLWRSYFNLFAQNNSNSLLNVPRQQGLLYYTYEQLAIFRFLNDRSQCLNELSR